MVLSVRGILCNRPTYFCNLVSSPSPSKYVDSSSVVLRPPKYQDSGLSCKRLITWLQSASNIYILPLQVRHQQKTFPCGRNGCVRVDPLCQSRQRHVGGGLLLAQRRYYASRCMSPSDRCFAVSSHAVTLLLFTNTLALWSTVTIHRNGFIGYTLAAGLPLQKSLPTFFLHSAWGG